MSALLRRHARNVPNLVLLVLLCLSRPVGALDLRQLQGLLNTRCVNFAVLGPCLCTPFTPCLTVTYWEPGWLVETVKQPGTTILGSLAPGMATVWRTVGLAFPHGGGGAGASPGSGQRNLQYNEAHVLPFPRLIGGPCTGCRPQGGPLAINYLSEIDPLWRLATGLPPFQVPGLVGFLLGSWGALYPRSGFGITGSAPVGSGLAAARALDIASNPLGNPTLPEARVVLQPTGGSSQCCQLALPRQTGCFPVGTNPALWETGTVSADGTYLWIFWRRRTCCVDPGRIACGLTLLGAEANLCVN
ncbi:MAG: TraU family protein [Candidatus Tectimicrobiota bacterium]